MDKHIIVISWPKWDFSMLVARIFSKGEVLYRNVNEMVDKIVTELGPGNKIRLLDILAHGNDMSINIGADSITAANFSKHEATLSKLRGKFTTGALVKLHGCRSACHSALLSKFAHAFGTRARMGFGLQWCFTSDLDGEVAESFKGQDWIILNKDS